MPPQQDPGFASRLSASLAASIEGLDRAAAVRACLNAVHSAEIDISDLYTLVLGPLLAHIGSNWQHGTERIWQEHFASHVVRTIVEALYPDVEREATAVPRVGSSVLLACPPKEQHELGLRMLADRFELAGYGVTFLGADTPLDEIVSAAHATRARLVALSVSTVFERVELRRFIDTLREQLPGVRIVIGGPAFAHDRQWPAEDLLDTQEFGLPGSHVVG